MHASRSIVTALGLIGLSSIRASAQQPAAAQPDSVDPIQVMVSRLDLERYKATLKGLTQFGDRRQGTDRNRA
ncbi:MAG TPA: peptidase M28, partial [Gemmatimonadaceae bacterium]|nr:peptidase M28 [Gemmatimonadaceae bacterium]